MYLYFGKDGKLKTKINHDAPPRQGGDLNVTVCLDMDFWDDKEKWGVDGDKYWVKTARIKLASGVLGYPQIATEGQVEVFSKLYNSEIVYDLVPGASYLMYKFRFPAEEVTKIPGQINFDLSMQNISFSDNKYVRIGTLSEFVEMVDIPGNGENCISRELDNLTGKISNVVYKKGNGIDTFSNLSPVIANKYQVGTYQARIEKSLTNNDEGFVFVQQDASDRYTYGEVSIWMWAKATGAATTCEWIQLPQYSTTDTIPTNGTFAFGVTDITVERTVGYARALIDKEIGIKYQDIMDEFKRVYSKIAIAGTKPDWNVGENTSPAYIYNKPDIKTVDIMDVHAIRKTGVYIVKNSPIDPDPISGDYVLFHYSDGNGNHTQLIFENQNITWFRSISTDDESFGDWNKRDIKDENPDWNVSENTSPSYIYNKPNIKTVLVGDTKAIRETGVYIVKNDTNVKYPILGDYVLFHYSDSNGNHIQLVFENQNITWFRSLPSGGKDFGPWKSREIREVLHDGGKPTSSTTGIVGQFFVDSSSQDLYYCVSAIDNVYTWERLVNLTYFDSEKKSIIEQINALKNADEAINGQIANLETSINNLSSDITTITSGLDTKYDKTGGTISGDVKVTGSVSSDGPITSKDLTVLNNAVITGNATIGGSLTVTGAVTSVETTNVSIKDQLFEIAKGDKGNVGLKSPAGFYVANYDGNGNNLAIVFDKTGTAYVGDVAIGENGLISDTSHLQPFATRQTTAITDKSILQWDQQSNSLKDSGKTIDDFIEKQENNTGYNCLYGQDVNNNVELVRMSQNKDQNTVPLRTERGTLKGVNAEENDEFVTLQQLNDSERGLSEQVDFLEDKINETIAVNPGKTYILIIGDSVTFTVRNDGVYSVDMGDGTIYANISNVTKTHNYTRKGSAHIITVSGVGTNGDFGFALGEDQNLAFRSIHFGEGIKKITNFLVSTPVDVCVLPKTITHVLSDNFTDGNATLKYAKSVYCLSETPFTISKNVFANSLRIFVKRDSLDQYKQAWYQHLPASIIVSEVDSSDLVNEIVQTTGQSTTAVMSQKATTDEISTLKGDLTDLDEILNVKHLRIAYVTTTGSYVRAIAFSGLSLIGGHSYTFTVKPVSVTTNEYYLYFVDASGAETVINTKVDGNILYDFTPTEDMNNVSIKVSSGANDEQTFECSWIENVGDNEIDKVNTRIDNLFDGTKVVELSILNGYFVTSVSGFEGVITRDSNSCATSFIPVRPNDKLRIDNIYLESNRSICAYDEERNFVDVIVKNRGDKVTSYTFTVPENCYYIRATGKTGVVPTVTFLNIPNNLDSLRVENPIATITNGYFITRYSGLEGLATSDSESAVTDYIPVKANSVISIDGTYNDGLRCTCAYDVNKKFVAVLVSYLEETNFSKNIKIPSNARYIRITSRKDVVPTIKYVNTIIDGSNVSNPYVNGKELFDSSTLKPVLTFIDDDTWAIEYVTRQKELCDRLGIKCSFACLTEQVEKNEGLLELLLSYEREGFPIIFHANQQIGAYDTSTLDVVAEERDFVTGLQKMHKFGFSDYKIWCTPFGSSREDQKKLAYKWGFDGLVTSGYEKAYNNPYEYSSRFVIKRNSLGSNTDTTASDIVDDVANIKLAIDNASECNGWVCISTHSAYTLYRNGEADNAMEEIVNYAISKGFEIRTVNEELRRRMPIYHYYEQF